ncbi:MAG: glycosyltransferase family 39 protein [Betaproteobacteria bacterium]
MGAAAIAVWHYLKLLEWSKTTTYNFDAVHSYMPLARKLLDEGPAFLLTEQAMQVPPFAYVFPALFGADLLFQAQLHMVLSVIALLALYRTGLLMHSHVAGLACAAAYGLTPNLWPFMATASVDPIHIFLIALWTWSLAEGESGKRWGFVVAGVVMGLATLTRATTLYFLPLIIVLGWWCSRRPGANAGFWKGVLHGHAIALAFVAPVLIKNLVMFGIPAVSTGAGIALLLGSHPLMWGMDGSYFNIANDHIAAMAPGQSHLDVASDKSMLALARFMIWDQPFFTAKMYATKVVMFLFVTNREWVMPVELLRGWRIVFIALAACAMPLARLRPLVTLLLVYVLFQLAIHTPALYAHRYSVGALEVPLAVLGGLGAAYLLFHARLRVTIVVLPVIVCLVLLGSRLARNHHYPLLNIDRVAADVAVSYSLPNLPISATGFKQGPAGSYTQSDPVGTMEIDLSRATQMHAGSVNVIALRVTAVDIGTGGPVLNGCQHVKVMYRDLAQPEFSENRVYYDEWPLQAKTPVFMGGQWHLRVTAPGVLKLQFNCPRVRYDFTRIEVLQPHATATYRDVFFKQNGVSSWQDWATKTNGKKSTP